MSLDHVVVLVRDLASAVRDYSGLGFTVAPGGSHAGRSTHNALIGFADGTYLELIAFTRPFLMDLIRWLSAARALSLALLRRPAMERRFVRRAAAGEGLADWAAVLPTLAAARRLGSRASFEGPFPGHRVATDGARISWDVFVPRDDTFPFVVVDGGARSLRVPEESRSSHSNGALGIAAIGLAVPDVQTCGRSYAALLEGRCSPTDTPRQISFPCPHGGHRATIVLVPSGPVRRGPGTSALQWLALRTGDAGRAGLLDANRTHGASIRLV